MFFRHTVHIYTVRLKIAPFCLCNNSLKPFYTEMIIGTLYSNKFGTKTTSKLSISLEACLYSALWNAARVRLFISDVM